jgi:chorismate synthase
MKANFEKLGLEIYGESHSESIGVILSGLPKGEKIDFGHIERTLGRRKSGDNVWSTPRKEEDAPVFYGGVENGLTTGGELRAEIKNGNIKARDYENIRSVPRPSHADFASFAKDGYISSGGGRFSGRMTAPLCIAGSVAEQILASRGVEVCAYVSEIGGISAGSYADTSVSETDFARLKNSPLPLLDEKAAVEIENAIRKAAGDKDSLGGVVECVVTGLKAGEIGDAMTEGLESKIAYAVFGVPAVKGVEFGAGFALSKMRGSQANDPFVLENGKPNIKVNGGLNENGDPKANGGLNGKDGFNCQFNERCSNENIGSLLGKNQNKVGHSIKNEAVGLTGGAADGRASRGICGYVRCASNNSGGINGGITNGMSVTLRAAFRPTPSIAKAQESVDLSTGESVKLEIKGRHDACIVPRAAVCVESAVALAVLDEMLKYGRI